MARSQAAPVFKWAGGKRWLAPTLTPVVRHELTAMPGSRYFEPFLGGAAVALQLAADRMVLADIEVPLVRAYTAVRTAHHSVSRELELLVRAGTTRVAYMATRAARPTTPEAEAARLIYLNRLCFNGLYRTNRRGEFNVPYGDYKAPAFPTQSHLRAVSTALRGATLVASDFEDQISRAGAGDVVFADPPYDTEARGFRSYHQQPFTGQDQVRLAEALRAAHRRGAVVFTTNSDTSLIRSLYEWAHITRTSERRAINRIASARGGVGCVLISAVHPDRVRPSAKLIHAPDQLSFRY